MAGPQTRKISKALRRLTERVITKMTLDVTAELIKTTPVDTGWARANWIPSIGQRGDQAQVASPAASDASARGAQQQAGVASVVTTYRLPLGAVFISNNVDYIVSLNEGSSAQAPAAFVQAAIRSGVRQLRDIRTP